jgi:hypothetical protein
MNFSQVMEWTDTDQFLRPKDIIAKTAQEIRTARMDPRTLRGEMLDRFF